MKSAHFVALAGVVVAVFAVTAAAKQRANGRLPMIVSFTPPADCKASFAGETFSLPNEENGMTIALRKLRRTWSSISITGGQGTPYRCIGHATYLAQRGGFRKVGFVSEPPAP